MIMESTQEDGATMTLAQLIDPDRVLSPTLARVVARLLRQIEDGEDGQVARFQSSL